MKLWGQLTKGRSNGGLIASTEEGSDELDSLCVETTGLAQAKEVAQSTQEFLATRGWCLWQCETLGGDAILVVDDFAKPKELPAEYPVYTLSEIDILFGGDKPSSHNTLRLIQEAKKMAGAKVASKVTNNEGGNSWRS